MTLSLETCVEYIGQPGYPHFTAKEIHLFTGLVEEKTRLHELHQLGENWRIVIQTQVVGTDAQVGDSISVNGCCLTIVKIEDHLLSFDAVPETMQRTSLGQLRAGDFVNVERALTSATRLGGHYVTGHVDGLGTISLIDDHPDWRKIHVDVPLALANQMASKGSVAVDGVSLTLVDVGDNSFSVVLIPHTLAATTIGDRKTGELVNIETDLLAKYVERQLQFLNKN